MTTPPGRAWHPDEIAKGLREAFGVQPALASHLAAVIAAAAGSAPPVGQCCTAHLNALAEGLDHDAAALRDMTGEGAGVALGMGLFASDIPAAVKVLDLLAAKVRAQTVIP